MSSEITQETRYEYLDRIQPEKRHIDLCDLKYSDREDYDQGKLEIMDLEECYDEMVDDCEGETMICGLKYRTSQVWKDTDRIAYDQGLIEYIDSRFTELEDDAD